MDKCILTQLAVVLYHNGFFPSKVCWCVVVSHGAAAVQLHTLCGTWDKARGLVCQGCYHWTAYIQCENTQSVTLLRCGPSCKSAFQSTAGCCSLHQSAHLPACLLAGPAVEALLGRALGSPTWHVAMPPGKTAQAVCSWPSVVPPLHAGCVPDAEAF